MNSTTRTTYTHLTSQRSDKYVTRDFVSALCRYYGTRDESELLIRISEDSLHLVRSILGMDLDTGKLHLMMAWCNIDQPMIKRCVKSIIGEDCRRVDDGTDAMWCLGIYIARHNRHLWHDIANHVRSVKTGMVPMSAAPDFMKVAAIAQEMVLSLSMYLDM